MLFAWLAACLTLPLGLARAQQPWIAPRAHHAWGRFPVGSWKRVHVTTTSYGPTGGVTSESTTSTRSELEAVDDQGFTLRVEVTVEVAGKRFEAEPKRVRQQFSARPDATTRTGTRTVMIGDQELAVEVHEWSKEFEQTRLSNRLYVSSGCPPYVIKRYTKATGGPQQMALFETWVDVIALNEVQRVLGEARRVWQVRTVHESEEEKSTVTEMHCADVPGGVVSHESKLTDKMDNLVQASNLKLVEFHVPAASNGVSTNRGRLLPWLRHGHP